MIKQSIDDGYFFVNNRGIYFYNISASVGLPKYPISNVYTEAINDIPLSNFRLCSDTISYNELTDVPDNQTASYSILARTAQTANYIDVANIGNMPDYYQRNEKVKYSSYADEAYSIEYDKIRNMPEFVLNDTAQTLFNNINILITNMQTTIKELYNEVNTMAAIIKEQDNFKSIDNFDSIFNISNSCNKKIIKDYYKGNTLIKTSGLANGFTCYIVLYNGSLTLSDDIKNVNNYNFTDNEYSLISITVIDNNLVLASGDLYEYRC
jgi:hypothetical protein